MPGFFPPVMPHHGVCRLCPRLISGLLAAALMLTLQLPGPADARQLLDVRFGRQDPQVRAVLDLDAAGSFTQATSADGRIVTIDLVETRIKAVGSRKLTNLGPLIRLSIAPGATPTTAEVRFEADRPVQVVSITSLPAEAGAHHRIAIDFIAAPTVPAPTERPVTAPPAPPSPSPPPPPPAPSGLGRPLVVPEEARPQMFAPLPPRANKPAGAESARAQRLLDQAQQAHDRHDDTGAYALYREAADAGSPEAAFAVGQMYRLGVGTGANPTLAAFWYGEAAHADYPPAEMNLGVMQLRGIGIGADPAAGLAMIKRAAAHGNPSARDLLDDLARSEETHAPTGPAK